MYYIDISKRCKETRSLYLQTPYANIHIGNLEDNRETSTLIITTVSTCHEIGPVKIDALYY